MLGCNREKNSLICRTAGINKLFLYFFGTFFSSYGLDYNAVLTSNSKLFQI